MAAYHAHAPGARTVRSVSVAGCRNDLGGMLSIVHDLSALCLWGWEGLDPLDL